MSQTIAPAAPDETPIKAVPGDGTQNIAWNFYRGDTKLAHMFSTFHPTLAYEIYREDDVTRNKRVNTVEDAIAWLESEGL